jgi:hypothetical protein
VEKFMTDDEKYLEAIDEVSKEKENGDITVTDNRIKRKRKKKKLKTKTLIPGLIHLVDVHGKMFYLVLNGVTDNWKVLEYYEEEDDNFIYQPKQDLPIKYLDTGIVQTVRSKEYDLLLEDLISFIKKYLEMPHEQDYLILALWVFHTYLIEKFNVTPYLYFYGIKETGKTRAGEIITELAFMCEHLTSPTESTLFRTASYFKTAIVIDEICLWGEEGNTTVATLIKSRYKRGLSVPRTNLNKAGEDALEYFDIFGPLVICTTEEIPEIIESRCLTFLMQKNISPDVEIEIDAKEAAKLRNKLTAFRADFYNKEMPEVETRARRRLREITMPLYKILALIDSERRVEFDDYVEYEEFKKQIEDQSSFEAQLISGILKWYQTGVGNVLFTEEITGSMNVGRREKDYYSERKVSMTLRKLGFEKIRKENKRGYDIKKDLLKKLCIQFGFSEEI